MAETLTTAEADPMNAINYALDLNNEYGNPADAVAFLEAWRIGDLSEDQQYRDFVKAGGFSA